MEGKENTKGLGKDEELEDEEDQNDISGVADNDTGDDDDKGSDDKKGGKDTGKKGERSFSQTQVTKMMTREKNQGRAAAFKELGIDPKDTKAIKMLQAFVESQKSDEQKAAEKDAEAQSKQAEMEQRAFIAEAKAEAMMLGVKPQYVEDAVTLALSKMSDDTDMKTVLSELKEKYSLWFEESEEDGKDDKKDDKKSKTGQRGTGSSIKNSAGKKGKEESGLGARLAAQRKPQTQKSSYWGNR